jgi:flavorubredoxin
MENLLHDIACHGLKNRKVALIENGSWASSAAKRMREILSPCKGFEFISEDISFKSAMHTDSDGTIDKLVDIIASTI